MLDLRYLHIITVVFFNISCFCLTKNAWPFPYEKHSRKHVVRFIVSQRTSVALPGVHCQVSAIANNKTFQPIISQVVWKYVCKTGYSNSVIETNTHTLLIIYRWSVQMNKKVN